MRSTYLRKQDAPPLGLNMSGMVSPIRPEFIVYFSEFLRDRPIGDENRLLTASWKAYFPHTIRRGTVLCEGCHDNPRRLMRELPGDRIYELQRDGMKLPSFWSQERQQVTNGSFILDNQYRAITSKGPAYRKAYLKKWQSFINHDATSSSP